MVEKLLSDRSAPDIDYDIIGSRLEGYSGSDIRLVCKEAAMRPLRKLLFQL
jgi:katanin p60 ATPase-containing subunit A1